jgi:hypothetical protein
MKQDQIGFCFIFLDLPAGYKSGNWITILLYLLGGKRMKEKDQETSEGLNQIFEIINAKGDLGEIKEILERSNDDSGTENPHSKP